MDLFYELENYGVRVTDDPVHDALRYLVAVESWRIDRALQMHPNLIGKVADQAEAVQSHAPVLWGKVFR